MKTSVPFLIVVISLLVGITLPAIAQKLKVDGEASIGSAGNGNNLLTLVSERSWAFRQFGTGPSTALELADLTGLKNFIINTTANVGIGILLPVDKLHVNGSIRAVGPRISFGSSEYFEDGGGFIINCNGSLISAVDGADDLGATANRWRNIWATNGVINTSDAKMKSGVRDIAYGLKDIMQLHPVSFVWKDHPETGTKLGLIAQEVQSVIREVVVDHEFVREETSDVLRKVQTERLGMYYTDLIPVLIKGMQEQQQLIEEKEARIAELEAKAEKLAALEERLARVEQLLPQTTETDVFLQGNEQAYLKQNAPNPFTQNTSIEYYLPGKVKNAYLRITDPAGKILKMVKLENTGKGQVNLTAGELPSGTYGYTLIIDGKPLDSKLMVLKMY